MFDNSKLLELMKSQKVTFYRLWKLSGVSRTALYRLRDSTSTDPTFATVEKIAEALDVSMDEFRKK